MKKRPKVVIDTNVIVSGILTSVGAPAKIIQSWLAGRHFRVIISKELTDEVNEVLRRPKIKARLVTKQQSLRLILGKLFNQSERIKPAPISEGIFSDSKDHFLLELATSAGARMIISGDQGIVELKGFGEITFLTPEEFCKKIKI